MRVRLNALRLAVSMYVNRDAYSSTDVIDMARALARYLKDG